MTYHYEPEELAHSDTPHTCSRFNPERPPAQWVQDGWLNYFADGNGTRQPRMVQIQPEWLDLPCQYSNHRTDPACGHCPRRES